MSGVCLHQYRLIKLTFILGEIESTDDRGRNVAYFPIVGIVVSQRICYHKPREQINQTITNNFFFCCYCSLETAGEEI